MAIFRRRKSQTISDLEDYYANRNNRTGMAWLMAFLSLLVTVIVIGALFFGGRWLYRTITDNDSEGNNTVATQNEDSAPGSVNGDGTINQPESGQSSSNESQDDSEEATESEVAGDDSEEDFPSVVSEEAATTDEPSENEETAGVSTDEEDLPNTGAGDVLIIAPLVALAAGYLISRKYQLK